MDDTFEAFVRGLSSFLITLPPAPHAPGKFAIFARRSTGTQDEFTLDSIEITAKHVVHPLASEWPTSAFHCDRAEYKNGALRFYREADAFGFDLDQDAEVIVASGAVSAQTLEQFGTHDALLNLSGQHLASIRSYDAHVVPLPPPASPQQVEAAADKLLSQVPPRYKNVWAPSPIVAFAIVLLGLGLCGFAVEDYSFGSGDPILSVVAAIIGVSLVIYGLLAALLPRNVFRAMVWAIVDPSHRVPAWELFVVLAAFGTALIVLGVYLTSRAFATHGTQGVFLAVFILASGILFAGLGVVRLIPPATRV